MGQDPFSSSRAVAGRADAPTPASVSDSGVPSAPAPGASPAAPLASFFVTPPLPANLRSLLFVGGTFDPPHRAHVNLATAAADALHCDRILFVPARHSPLKNAPATPSEHRLAMLRLAVQGVARASISPFELERPAPSYTVETLEALRAAIGPRPVVRLLLGSDQALEFHRWRDPRRVLELATPAIVLRPPHTPASFDAAPVPGAWADWIVDLPLDPVSSTIVRDRLQRGLDVRGLLCPEVLDYIRAHNLYRAE